MAAQFAAGADGLLFLQTLESIEVWDTAASSRAATCWPESRPPPADGSTLRDARQALRRVKEPAAGAAGATDGEGWPPPATYQGPR